MGIIRSKYYGIIRGVTVGIAFLLQIVTMVLLSLYLIKGFFVVYLLLFLFVSSLHFLYCPLAVLGL